MIVVLLAWCDNPCASLTSRAMHSDLAESSVLSSLTGLCVEVNLERLVI